MTLKLSICAFDPPTEVLIVTEIIKSERKGDITISWCKDWKEKENTCLYDKNGKLLAKHSNEINRYFARSINISLYGGTNPREKTEVDHWLSFALLAHSQSPEIREKNLNYLNHTLLLKTWLVNKRLTLADIHVFCTLLRTRFIEESGSNYSNITRWYKHIESLSIVQDAFSEIAKNKLEKLSEKKPAAEQLKARKQEGKFIDLPEAELGKVVVRFPPEASGYLHIGHAKAALLNNYYARETQGTFIMRFDDTNPAKETVEFEEAILQDVALLQIKPDQFTHTSDYFELLEEYCTTLIKKGKAFVDNTPAHLMKEQRDQKLKSENRDNCVEKNLELWEEMRYGTEKGQQCCVRAKIDYQSKNGCMRDPTIYRCKPEPHPRTGNKYKVYPTYDFACPIVDAIENVTHTLRTTEYHDRDDQFYWIIEALGLRRPYIWEYSRLNMTHTVLSKRKLTWFVNEGLVDGWDDPRLPTVRGILRRGMTVEGLTQFIVAQGSSRSVVFMEWDKIWAFNKKVIDPIAVRYTALNYNKMVTVTVVDAKEEWLSVQNHPKDPSKGIKHIRVGRKILIERDDAECLVAGQNATFINWGNLMILKVDMQCDYIEARLNLEDRNYKNTIKLTWLAAPLAECDKNAEESNPITCYLVYFDHIMTVPVLGKDDDFKDFVAKNTRKEVQILGEIALKRVRKGEIIQLQRKGFFICDVPYTPISPYSSREQPIILFYIPDGHTSSVMPTVSYSQNTLCKDRTKETKDTRPKENPEEISEEIKKQGDKVRNLKSTKADKSVIDQEVKILLTLKNSYKIVTGQEWKPDGHTTLSAKSAASHSKQNTLCKENLKENPEEISEEIKKQGDKVRNLKSMKDDKSVIDQEVKILLTLKNNYKIITGQEWKPDGHTTPSVKPAISHSKQNTLCKENQENPEEISEEIKKQGDKVRNLKSMKADKSVIDQEVKILLTLKNSYKSVTGQEWKPTNLEVIPKKKQVDASKFAKTLEKEVAKSATNKDADINKTGTRLGLEAKKEENFFDWYSQVITKSGMIEYYDVSGCYILRPWSYAIWKIIKDYIDEEITSHGVQECYFPIFVTRSVLEKEKTHIADFAPEVAWVTKCGESDLAEPIAIRPTSETVMYPAYAKWLRSDTELPLRLNQWNNVVRWEFKDPKPFLRTREFLWQEGHTAFATKEEADEEVLMILDMYARVYEDLLAVPVIKGRKTEKEKFAGGDYTTTVEAFISTSGRAIQGATSHHLGQNFSKMFNIQVEGATGDQKTFVYQNSWGLTTRTIGVMIMVHGDDKGLVLPPNVACIQAIVVPCGITASTIVEQRELLHTECIKLVNELSKNGKLRVKGDFRNNRTPGWKFNHWELKGVPVRIELGPKDMEKNQVTFVRRDNFQKKTAKRNEVITALASLLNDIQSELLSKARKNLNAHIKQIEDWNDFVPELNKKNLLLSPFCGESACEDNIKADSAREDSDNEPGALSMGAKSLCIPFEQPKLTKALDELKCIHHSCKNKSKFYTLFGRSY